LKDRDCKNIIHWDETGTKYWISNEETLHQHLAKLNGNSEDRAALTMRRFFRKSADQSGQKKKGFALYDNIVSDYTPSSEHHPQPNKKDTKKPHSNQEKKRRRDSSEVNRPSKNRCIEEKENDGIPNGRRCRKATK